MVNLSLNKTLVALKNKIKTPKNKEISQKDLDNKGITENDVTREPVFSNNNQTQNVEDDLPF